MTILLICADEARRNRIKEAIQSAGFRLISVRAVDEAWAKSDFFDFGAVVIDHELKNDVAASAFRQRFIVWTLEADAAPEAMAADLAQVLRGRSELVQ